MNSTDVPQFLAECYGLDARGLQVTEIHAGPASRAWRVDVRADRRSYCLKDHRRGDGERLVLEHSLIEAMREAGFILAPGVVEGTAGDTTFGRDGAYYALYRFIESDAAFNWTVGGWSRDQARAAGAALADFHIYADRVKASVASLGASSADELRDWGLAVLRRASGLFPDDVMIRLGNFEEALRSAFVIAADQRTHGIVHGDFHPGNVLFEGEQVVGVLDYEYCRMDSRLFDVAYATMTFSFEHMDPAYGLALLDGYNGIAEKSGAWPEFVPLDISTLQPLVRLSAWLSAIWLIEQCQKGAAGHDEVLPGLRKCIAILSATLD